MFDILNFPLVSPTAGKDREGILLGQITPTNFVAVVLESKVIPVVEVFIEDVTATGRSLVNVTAAATNAAAGDFPPFGTSATMSAGDAFYFRVEDGKECNTLHSQIATPGVGTWEMAVQEWDTAAEAWVDMTISEDNTNDFRAAAGVHTLKFTHVKKGSVKLNLMDSAKHVWHRVYLKNFTNATTAPVLSRLWVSDVVFNYTDITSQVNNGNWTGFNGEFLPELEAHTDWIHPGPPMGLDTTVTQVASGTYTTRREYLATDGTWKPIPNIVDPSNDHTVLGASKIRWSRPADWTKKSYTFLGQTVEGWIEKRVVTSIVTAGPTQLWQLSAKSRSLGAANAQGLESPTAVTYTAATFTIGDNRATGDTVINFENVDTGAAATITIPSGVEDASALTGGKVPFAFSLAAGNSTLPVCISGGPLLDVTLRMHQ